MGRRRKSWRPRQSCPPSVPVRTGPSGWGEGLCLPVPDESTPGRDVHVALMAGRPPAAGDAGRLSPLPVAAMRPRVEVRCPRLSVSSPGRAQASFALTGRGGCSPAGHHGPGWPRGSALLGPLPSCRQFAARGGRWRAPREPLQGGSDASPPSGLGQSWWEEGPCLLARRLCHGLLLRGQGWCGGSPGPRSDQHAAGAGTHR